jgi:hypothetical protein
MIQESKIPQLMQLYAQDAVKFAKERFNVELDFSEDSLERIDQILHMVTKNGIFPEKSTDPATLDNLWVLSKMFGGYVGEVIIRHMGAGAVWEEEKLSDGSRALLRFSNQGQASPPQKIWKRLTQSPYDGVSGYYRGLKHVIMEEMKQK